MNFTFPIDSHLTENLVKTLVGSEYILKLEQVEMLLLAFEKKIIHYSKAELLYLRTCLQTYIKVEPESNTYITKSYLKLLTHYLKVK